ncbi:DUF3322 and DUF2220 domain-containing protein [Paludibacter sp. 221]|uniref:Wadjet anti-phage system protein JetD domain-containing protein n=1 Tax=Paludibacter sp. 221 TaxID=2302939 RepID=UPI0013D2E2EF|nr:DUF3322 and DUF2220 domain-containing protein [Paludibacter sp. 221]NDV46332.1 DUF3322 and DUF2220 domain-containing protein [Paludibacter sp. 221]
MITPTEIKFKAEKKYSAYLQSIVMDIPFDKIIILGDKKPSRNLAEYQTEITALLSQSKEKKGYGYIIKFHTISKKEIGKQDIPSEISFQTESDFLKFLHKEKEVAEFRTDYRLILSRFSELKEWIIKYPKKIIENHLQWNDLLKVCDYFTKNPKPNLYIRELPIQIHTKFIEKNKGIIKELLDILISGYIDKNETNFEKRFNLKYAESTVRFRILDKNISSHYFSEINDLNIPICQFEKLYLPIKKVFVAENKMNIFTFPLIEKSLIIFGCGFGVEILKNVEWLKHTELYYWGDIDAQGFEILSQFRGYFPNVKSILMDKLTFDKYYDDDKGTPNTNSVELNLTIEEQELYELLKENNLRLEQEKVPLEYVSKIIRP